MHIFLKILMCVLLPVINSRAIFENMQHFNRQSIPRYIYQNRYFIFAILNSNRMQFFFFS